MSVNLRLCTLGVLFLLCVLVWPTGARHVANEPKGDRAADNRSCARRPTPEAYNTMRSLFFRYEESKFLGADIILSQKELEANHVIMDFKIKEFEEGLIVPHLFTPSQHLFSVLDAIRDSPLFRILSKMPKGAVLHSHDTALCSSDFLLKLTYREKLWSLFCPTNQEMIALRFSNSRPNSDVRNDCGWELLSLLRQQYGAVQIDGYLAKRFTMYPTEKFLDNNEAWQKFMSIFAIIDGLLLYAPVWADYYYRALEEFYADGVQYLEFRTTLPKLYDLEGSNYTEIDTVRIYNETLTKFMEANTGFIGSKMIYAPNRHVDQDGLASYIEILLEIKDKYPHFVAGFDLVGQEEMGRPLKDFVPQLLALPEDIEFFFHAGETNWFGSTVDENLVDAVLLGTKRIGHGFALVKHPSVLEMIKQRNIAVEVNPISNQVLQLVSDLRNHPCAHLFADNYPVVISSDDPSFWKATPLSHDFYIAFLGIASAHTDLRLLKKLALNSITYSSMSTQQQAQALRKWQTQWDAFIADIVADDSSAAQRRLVTNFIV